VNIPALIALMVPQHQHEALAQIAQEMLDHVRNGGAWDDRIDVIDIIRTHSLSENGWHIAVSILALRLASK
jgi:hypothetical protein